MDVTSDSSNDRHRRPGMHIDGQLSGEALTTRERIASSVGLYAPSPRDIEDTSQHVRAAKQGVYTRRMCRELEETVRMQQDVSTSVHDRAQTPGNQSQEGTDQTPSTPSTPASQIMRREGPAEVPGAPRKTRLMRIHPEDWNFASQVARRLDILSDDVLQRHASTTSETGSYTE